MYFPRRNNSLTLADWIAVLFSLLAVLAAYQVGARVFEQMAHLEDEFAYIWQAQVIAEGKLTLPSPPEPASFLVPFVVDHEGQRFGKYPLGWPVVLSFGERFDVRSWVNPLLAGLAVWLTYRLGKRVFGEVVGLLAAGLTLTSPFFLVNAGSLLSHPWGLVLSTTFALAWVDAFIDDKSEYRWLAAITAGMSLGVLALSRPFTMLGVALPFGVHGVVLLVKGDRQTRRQVMTVGLIALLVSSLHFLWQYALTGDPLLNPYTLWWEYDKVGFGPGFGVTEDGHNLQYARFNTKHSLRAVLSDLFGWAKVSWLFLPLGLWAIRKRAKTWTLAAVFPVLILVYAMYWVGSWLFGPRYYFEGLYSLTLLSAVGIAWAAGWATEPGGRAQRLEGWAKARPLGVTALLALLVSANILFYLPPRMEMMHGLYSIERADLAPFMTPEAGERTPALVIVYPESWMEYGSLLEMTTPFQDTPFIIVYRRSESANERVKEAFPEHTPYYYYTDEPGVFRDGPRPEPEEDG